MKKQLQNGFAHLGLLLLIVAIVLVALMGYKVVKDRNNTVNTSTTSSAQQIPNISSKADLNKAASTLNSENVDGDLNPDSLNQDVDSLL